jgi:hypothetical protein
MRESWSCVSLVAAERLACSLTASVHVCHVRRRIHAYVPERLACSLTASPPVKQSK